MEGRSFESLPRGRSVILPQAKTARYSLFPDRRSPSVELRPSSIGRRAATRRRRRLAHQCAEPLRLTPAIDPVWPGVGSSPRDESLVGCGKWRAQSEQYNDGGHLANALVETQIAQPIWHSDCRLQDGSVRPGQISVPAFRGHFGTQAKSAGKTPNRETLHQDRDDDNGVGEHQDQIALRTQRHRQRERD